MISPDLLYTVICDEVRREHNGKWILLGLFEDLSLPNLPFAVPRCCIINKWTGGEGHHTQQTRFVDSDDRVLLASETITFELLDLDASFTAVQIFDGLKIEKAGKVWVEILLDGELKQRYAVRVNVVPQ